MPMSHHTITVRNLWLFVIQAISTIEVFSKVSVAVKMSNTQFS